MNPWVIRPIGYSGSQLASRLVGMLVYHSVNESIGRSTGRSVRFLARQSVGPSCSEIFQYVLSSVLSGPRKRSLD